VAKTYEAKSGNPRCGAHANAIRFLYPLTIEEELFDRALTILKNAFEKARQS